ncbi:triple gene block 2 protein [Phlox virus B]|uniref:Movement protein TGB2 n=1 Tax=Phlox virus B TaxID=475777 RepID=A8II60_9VIRU|nr:triple gene block 2 protein [Phlox virus B]ABW05094.1 triple gene block 2 protein [Phlox virus B]
MPLTPPPDHTRSLLAVAIGFSIIGIVLVYSRSTLPFTGDNIHSLPHGGLYKDGTKQIQYGAPRKLNSLEGPQKLATQPWAYVLLLTLLILISVQVDRFRVCRCGVRH